MPALVGILERAYRLDKLYGNRTIRRGEHRLSYREYRLRGWNQNRR